MGTSVIDSKFFGNQFSTEETRRIFSDENMVQKWLDTEAALAKVEKELGLIPAAAADEICKKAKYEYMDIDYMIGQMEVTAHPVVPLLRSIKNACDGDAGEYCHWGATTQDIMDTGMILQIREAYNVMMARVSVTQDYTLALAEKYKHLVACGRTHGQHALPITFGFKFAVWAEELRRNIERLTGCRERLFVGQFSGAVGTIASLGAVGLEVQKKMMSELGLGVPVITWHTSRDNLAEFISILGMLTSTLGKICNELMCLQKTEFHEVEEPFVMGKVGSSTMPHKRNPMFCENVVVLSKLVRAEVPVALEAMVGEHERDMRTWQTEWDFIGRTCCMADAAIAMTNKVLSGLIVYPEKVEKNLYILKGLMLSEAVMMRLGKKLGRQNAHEIVYESCMEAFEQDIDLLEVLWTKEIIRENFCKDDLAVLIDPQNYTGLAAEFVDRVLGK